MREMLPLLERRLVQIWHSDRISLKMFLGVLLSNSLLTQGNLQDNLFKHVYI